MYLMLDKFLWEHSSPYLTFHFDFGREHGKEKKRYIKNFGHAWIRTTVCQAVSVSSHTCLIYTLEQLTYIRFTCTRQINFARPLVSTILHDPWFTHQNKIERPFGLHLIVRPWGRHYNIYRCLARPLSLHFNFNVPCDIHTRAIYLSTLKLQLHDLGSALYWTTLCLFVRLKFHDPWFCAMLNDP